MKEQGYETNREERRQSVQQRKCNRVSGDRAICNETVHMRGRSVSDTSGEEAAVKTVYMRGEGSATQMVKRQQLRLYI